MEIRVTQMESGNSMSEAVVATAEVQVGPVRIRNVRLVRRRDGSGCFVSWPARKDRDSDQWIDLVYVPDRDVYDRVVEAVMDASRQHAGGGGSDVATTDDRRTDDDVPF